MDERQIQEIVLRCFREYLESQDIELEVGEETRLIGSEAVIDSMGLVNVIIDIESNLLDHDVEVSLTSDRAMSQKHSPFRTVRTLTAFILESIGENDA